MAQDDPFEQLVTQGIITRAQLDEALRMNSDMLRTTAGKLLAVGVDRAKLYGALAQQSGLPLLEHQPQFEFPPTFTPLPDHYEKILREALAGPIGKSDDGTLDVVVGDPRSVKKLAASGIKFRAQLAVETVVIDALEWVWPSDESKPIPLALDSKPKQPDGRPRVATGVPGEAPQRQVSRSVPRPAEQSGGGGALKIVAILVVVAGIGAFAAFKAGLIGGKATGVSPAVAAEQAKKLEEARLLARKGEHSWAVTTCQEAVALAPSTPAGLEGALFCAEESLQVGEKNKAVDILTALKKSLKPDDPLHARVDALLKQHQ